MKTYSHDYTLPFNACRAMLRAYKANREGRKQETENFILQARSLLDAYLAGDNMVPDDDCADGWVKQRDVENEIHDDH